MEERNEQLMQSDAGSPASGTGAGTGTLAPQESKPVPENSRRERPSSLSQILVDAGMLSVQEIAQAQDEARRERLPLFSWEKDSSAISGHLS